MKAVTFHAIGDIRVDDVQEPKIEDPKDAIVRLTASAICGTDLHFVRGTFSGMRKGQILGHEGVGVVEEVGAEVRNIRVGQRVIIPSTIGCGVCRYCKDGYFAQCDNANPGGKRAGTAFFGGPEGGGGYKGLQAEFEENVRGLHANSDADAILRSDVDRVANGMSSVADRDVQLRPEAKQNLDQTIGGHIPEVAAENAGDIGLAHARKIRSSLLGELLVAHDLPNLNRKASFQAELSGIR